VEVCGDGRAGRVIPHVLVVLFCLLLCRSVCFALADSLGLGLSFSLFGIDKRFLAKHWVGVC
jgi:hypothetical protein